MLPDEDDDLGPERSVTAGELFKALRDGLGLSQRQFAKQLGVDHTHILRIEREGSTPGAGLLASCEERFHLAPGYLSYCLENMPFELVLPVDDPRHEFYWANEFPDYAFIDGPETIENLNVDASINDHGMCGPWQANWSTSCEGRPRNIMRLHLAGECDGLLLGSEVSGSVGVSGHGTQVDPLTDGYMGAHEDISLEDLLETSKKVRFRLTKGAPSWTQSLVFRPGPGQMIEHCRIRVEMPQGWDEEESHLRLQKIDQTDTDSHTFSAHSRSLSTLATTELKSGVACFDSTNSVEVEFGEVRHGRSVGVAWKLWPSELM